MDWTAELGKIESEARNLVGILGEQGPNTPRRTFYESRLDELAARRQEIQEILFRLDKEIIELECQQIDASLIHRYMQNFIRVLNKPGDKERKEILCLLVKEITFDGDKSKVQIALKPLPKIWGDVTTLEDWFVYRKTWLPG